jgi:hypothetical protein
MISRSRVSLIMCAGGARFMLWPVRHSERGECHIERDNTLAPRSFSILGGGNNSINTSTAQRFATVFNADIQVGVSYWFTQNVKLGVSYRLDAFINVQNQDTSAVTNLTPDRYTHGPRVAVTGQF